MQTITHNEPVEREDANTAGGAQSIPTNGHASLEDIENLVVRIAGSDETEEIDDLTARAGGASPPSGALMLAAVDGKLLAAASMSRREAVNEPTFSGLAARAVVEYTLADLERRGRIPRRAA